MVRARIYLADGEFQRAAADAERAVALAPEDRMALDSASVAFTEVVRMDAAKAAADRLVALAPDNAEALNARCWILALTPDPEAALPDCDAAIAAGPEEFQAYDSRALTYWLLGRIPEARADLARAAEIKPDFWDWSKREEYFVTVMTRRYLKSLGHYDGPIDGGFDDLGPTVEAIRAYQADIGIEPTGEQSPALMTRLGQDVAKLE